MKSHHRRHMETNPDAIEDLVKRQAKPRLRFDKIALRFLGTMKAGLRDAVPDGKTVVLTIAAPIRVPSKAAAELETKIRMDLARGSIKADLCDPIQGNRVRVRILDSSRGAPKVLGYVHTPEPGAAETLIDMTESLLKLRFE